MSETNQNNKRTKLFKNLNRFFVIPLYRANILPIFFMGKVMLLFYTKGRKSGKIRITPLELRHYKDWVLIFSSRGRKGDWFQNSEANPDDVYVKIGFRKHKARAEKATLEEKFEILRWLMEEHPRAAKTLFGYNKKIDTISKEFMKPLAEYLEILKLSI